MATRSTTTLSADGGRRQSALSRYQGQLSRVGLTGIEKVIRVKADGTENLYHADFECFVDPQSTQDGVHMSRFEEVVGGDATRSILGEAFRASARAHIAQRVRERRRLAAEVSVAARYPETVTTPASGQRTQEI